jgi:hypothetical protein
MAPSPRLLVFEYSKPRLLFYALDRKTLTQGSFLDHSDQTDFNGVLIRFDWIGPFDQTVTDLIKLPNPDLTELTSIV